MENNVKAVFYKFKYYILPPEFEDIQNIGNGTVINARRLKEENCMAPDFIYESIEDEYLEVEHPELLFVVNVNLYSAKEYDELLTNQVEKVCKGCSRYIEDDKELDLEGHYRELSLNGVCYLRETDDSEISFDMRIYWFYNRLSKRLDELADCIEKDDGDKFNEICMECAKCIPSPVRFFGGKKDGKYILYWQTFLGTELYYTLMHLIGLASEEPENPLTEAGWLVVPFIPEASELYKGTIDADKPTVLLIESHIPWRYIIKIFSDKMSDEEQEECILELHRYLSFNLGENVVLNTVEGYATTEDNSRLSTPAQICEALKSRAEEWQCNSFPPAVSFSWKDEGYLPYKRNVDGTSLCYTLSSIGVDTDVENVHFENGFAYAYVYVPATPDKSESVCNVLGTYFNNADKVPEPIRNNGDFLISFINAGFCECSGDGVTTDDGVIFDFLVANENEFYRFIKILAPVLKSYGARLVVVNVSGVNEYICGYEITAIATGQSN